MSIFSCYFFFFFNDTATTEIYTLSLHDALPISLVIVRPLDVLGPDEHDGRFHVLGDGDERETVRRVQDRKSTRLNSSHSQISYAVFCLKKKKKKKGQDVVMRQSIDSRQRQ